jgi:hypothetical protein
MRQFGRNCYGYNEDPKCSAKPYPRAHIETAQAAVFLPSQLIGSYILRGLKGDYILHIFSEREEYNDSTRQDGEKPRSPKFNDKAYHSPAPMMRANIFSSQIIRLVYGIADLLIKRKHCSVRTASEIHNRHTRREAINSNDFSGEFSRKLRNIWDSELHYEIKSGKFLRKDREPEYSNPRLTLLLTDPR